MIRSLVALAASAVLVGGPTSTAQDDSPRMLIGGVTVSERFVVFSYAGDLWKVARDGGVADRVTGGPEDDDFPTLSPDGLHVAFSRRGADDWDVYLVAIQGGEPQQLTFNPEADIARGWNAAGDTILFTSHRDEESVFRLYTIPAAGVFPTPVALPRAWDGALAPGGERIAYVPFTLPGAAAGAEWRHYRGGMASAIDLRLWVQLIPMAVCHSSMVPLSPPAQLSLYELWVRVTPDSTLG